MTAKELYDMHGPGVWWALKHAAEEKAFRPVGLSEAADIIVGETKRIAHSLTSYVAVGNENYVLYLEQPKKPVVRWQWAYKAYDNWFVCEYFYTEAEAIIETPGSRIKLVYTATEFEE